MYRPNLSERSGFMGRATTSSFVLTMPLRYEPWQRDKLDTMFKASNFMYNDLVADRKPACEQMLRTRKWKQFPKQIQALKEVIKKAIPNSDERKALEEELRNVRLERTAFQRKYGMTEYDFHAIIQKWRKHYSGLVNTNVAQKIATSVWQKFSAYIFGKGEELKFQPWQEHHSIEGKDNKCGIRFRDHALYIGKMRIPVAPAVTQYEKDALKNEVKYCRIVRTPWKDGWLYKVQLIMKGDAPVKVDPETGELLHPLGNGRVGMDIGTQTVANVSETMVRLEELADKVHPTNAEIRRLNRAMDRSRKATNPDFFNKDGTVKTIDKVDKSRLDRKGRRNWNRSKRYKRLEQRRRYLYAKMTRTKQCQHNEMTNRFLAAGNVFYTEKMDYRALQKRAKKQEPKPGEKLKRRKRFGKSIANKSPATFTKIMEEKVRRQGGEFHYINTWKAAASQYNHMTQTKIKKSLSQRMNKMPDGRKVQRDNDTLNGFIQSLCESTFEHFYLLHNLEIQRLRGIKTPSSTGVKYKP